MGTYLSRLMVQTGIHVPSGSNAPQHSMESSPEGPMTDGAPGSLDVENITLTGTENDGSERSEGGDPTIQRSPMHPQFNQSQTSNPSSGQPEWGTRVGFGSYEGNTTTQFPTDGTLRNTMVDHTSAIHQISGSQTLRNAPPGHEITRHSGDGTRNEQFFGLDHTPSHEITTGNILSEGLKESNNEPVASSLKPRSSEKISGYFGALSSNLVSADASSNDHGDLPSDQKSGITHEEENDRVASLIETSEKEKSTHGLSTSGEKTSRNFSANQEIRELQLSIGSISVTVEGPEGNEGNTEFHRQRSEAMPRQTPSFETEGAEIRRLRRHYLR